MRYLSAVILLFFVSMALVIAASPEDKSTGIVEVLVTFQDPNPIIPWQRGPVSSRRGYGILLQGGRILTVESLVHNAKMIEVRKAQSAVKIPAKVELSDKDCNLALLTAQDNSKISNLLPVEFADKAGLKDKVSIMQFDETAKLQTGDGDIILVSANQQSQIPVFVINYKVQTDLSINGIGSPVFIGDRLLGIVSGSGQKSIDIIGFPSLKRFMDDYATAPYEGIPTSGLKGKLLLDPSIRKYLGVPDDKGVMVLGTAPFSPANGKLLLHDIILSIDGYDIDNLGFYNDPLLGRLFFPYIINGYKKNGDTAVFKVLRDKKEVVVVVPLSRFDDNKYYIPEEDGPEDSEYLVTGGLIFRELSGRFLKAMGSRAESSNIYKLNYLLNTAYDNPPQPGQKVVFILTVLPDDINIGYQNINNQIVTAVNGQPIRSIDDLFAIKDKDGAISTVSLDGIGVDIVLDKSGIGLADKKIATQFGVPFIQYRKGHKGAANE